MNQMPERSQGHEISAWLADWQEGDLAARASLAAAVDAELRQIATRYLHQERANHTLEPNALVNELWVRLLDGVAVPYQNRGHFYAVAAQTMRRILIDYARARAAKKRGGIQDQVSLSAVDGWAPVVDPEDIIDLDAALSKLETVDPRAARVVEMRYFGGLPEEDVAAVLGVSLVTVKRDWKAARAWLAARLGGNWAGKCSP